MSNLLNISFFSSNNTHPIEPRSQIEGKITESTQVIQASAILQTQIQDFIEPTILFSKIAQTIVIYDKSNTTREPVILDLDKNPAAKQAYKKAMSIFRNEPLSPRPSHPKPAFNPLPSDELTSDQLEKLNQLQNTLSGLVECHSRMEKTAQPLFERLRKLKESSDSVSVKSDTSNESADSISTTSSNPPSFHVFSPQRRNLEEAKKGILDTPYVKRMIQELDFQKPRVHFLTNPIRIVVDDDAKRSKEKIGYDYESGDFQERIRTLYEQGAGKTIHKIIQENNEQFGIREII